MKIKTSELTGATLDWAVAKSKGITLYRSKEGKWMTADYGQFNPRHGAPWWHPSTNWGQGGPIIEREEITIEYARAEFKWLWTAYKLGRPDEDNPQGGPTPLIAAMRCFVASVAGEEIEIPEELAA